LQGSNGGGHDVGRRTVGDRRAAERFGRLFKSVERFLLVAIAQG
jgi:hypothetical protein